MSAGPDKANDAFHSAFDARRDETEAAVPILVVLANDLVLVRNGERATYPITPRAFDIAKGVAHAPVALWLIRRKPDPARVAKLRATVVSSLAELDAELAPLRPLLELTLAAIDSPSPDFGRAMEDELNRAIAFATKVQLAALHERTEEICALLDASERRLLRVAVTGDHQARERSLGMQYFLRRLGPERVLYAEGIEDLDSAVALVAANRLDRELALAFFGDEKRLQRDILGDAAEAELATFDVAKIDQG